MSQDRNVAAQVLKPLEQAADGFGAIVTVEVVGAEVAVFDAVAQHVVGGGEHGGGHSEDGLLGAAAGLEAQELARR